MSAVGEVRGLRLVPAAELLVDREGRHLREILRMRRGDLRIGRPVEVLGRDLLAFRRVEILEIGLRHVAGAMLVDDFVDDGDRRLGQDGKAGNHQLDLAGAEFLDGEEGFVLPRQQHVADAALHESGGAAAGTGIQHRHVAEQIGDELLGLGLIAARLLQRPAPGREIVPAGAAGGLRIGRDDLDAVLHQIAPVLDALRVALAHQEHDGRGVR